MYAFILLFVLLWFVPVANALLFETIYRIVDVCINPFYVSVGLTSLFSLAWLGHSWQKARRRSAAFHVKRWVTEERLGLVGLAWVVYTAGGVAFLYPAGATRMTDTSDPASDVDACFSRPRAVGGSPIVGVPSRCGRPADCYASRDQASLPARRTTIHRELGRTHKRARRLGRGCSGSRSICSRSPSACRRCAGASGW